MHSRTLKCHHSLVRQLYSFKRNRLWDTEETRENRAKQMGRDGCPSVQGPAAFITQGHAVYTTQGHAMYITQGMLYPLYKDRRTGNSNKIKQSKTAPCSLGWYKQISAHGDNFLRALGWSLRCVSSYGLGVRCDQLFKILIKIFLAYYMPDIVLSMRHMVMKKTCQK